MIVAQTRQMDQELVYSQIVGLFGPGGVSPAAGCGYRKFRPYYTASTYEDYLLGPFGKSDSADISLRLGAQIPAKRSRFHL